MTIRTHYNQITYPISVETVTFPIVPVESVIVVVNGQDSTTTLKIGGETVTIQGESVSIQGAT